MANKNEGTEVVEKVVMRPLADLVRNPKNPRKSDPQGLKDLCESIKRNPAYFNARPIQPNDNFVEYIRKDALIEWTNKMLQDTADHLDFHSNQAFAQLFDKLNSM